MSNADRTALDEEVAGVIEKELLLLQPTVRASQDAVLSMLHEDFREFGASGRRWDRSQIVARLAASPGDAVQADELRGVRLGDDIVLLTYVARTRERASLRSSLLLRDERGWRLFFHQGTVAPAEQPGDA